jgi:uncharacterized protein YfiM (DUF2279 family)
MINTWNESFLHEELKELYRGMDGKTEVPLEGSICDVVREDGKVIEIQTANISSLKNKLEKLLRSRDVKLVYPVAVNKTLETFSVEGECLSRRKSPKHGTIYQLFKEVTGIWHLLGHERFCISVVFADVYERRVADGSGSWRRKGIRIDNKKLEAIRETVELKSLEDYYNLVPTHLSDGFTRKDLAKAGAGTYAGVTAWVLTKLGILVCTGKRGNSFVYERCKTWKTGPGT